jgi:hypothetical protein
MVNNGRVEPASPAPAPTEPNRPTATSGPTGTEAAAGGQGAEAAAGGGAAARGRLARGQERSPRDMALSLAVLIVPIALLLIFYRTVLSGDSPITVDPAPTIQEAQQAHAFTVAVPQGLGADWYTSSATFGRQPDGATLRIGYVDPDKDPVQLVESSVPAATLLTAELTATAKPQGNFRSANGVWRAYQARPGEQALVLADQDRTIIVVGSAGMTNLERLASSLR